MDRLAPRSLTWSSVCLLCLLWGAVRAQTPRRVSDLRPTALPGIIRVENRIAVFRDFVYFAGKGKTSGTELYRAHLTNASVQLVRDIDKGPGSSRPFGFTVLGNGMFFVAADANQGFELWFTDGVATRLVKDLYPGPASSMVPNDQVRASMGVLRGRLLFAAEDPAGGYSLFGSDGTAPGTTVIKKLGRWSRRTPFYEFTVAGGFALFYAANEATDAFDLWQTDGTTAGTRRLLVLPRRGSSFLRPSYELNAVRLAAAGSDVFVTGTGSVWWIRPGAVTSRVTVLLRGAGVAHSGIAALPDPGQPGRQMFLFSSGTNLWRSNGTVMGTVPFYQQSGPGVLNSFRQTVAVHNGRLLFFGFDLQHGEEPWVTDGTPSGTKMLKDLRTGPFGSVGTAGFGRERRVVNDGTWFYFVASDGRTGLELWRTDGTSAATRVLADIHPGAGDASPRSLLALPGGGAVFVADDRGGAKVFVYSSKLDKVRVAAANFVPFEGRTLESRVGGLTPHDGRVYFAADDGKTGSEPWCSDGTAKGTFQLGDLFVGAGAGLRHHDSRNGAAHGVLAGISFGKDLYFTAFRTAKVLALFRTDGTVAGTVEVRDLDSMAGVGWNVQGLGVGETLFFHGYTAQTGAGLYAIRAGSSRLRQLVGGVLPGRYARLGSRLVFTDGAPPTLRGVWVSDGSPAGTMPLLRFARALPAPFFFAVLGRRAFFSAMQNGGELWSTDGTAKGTSRLRRVAVRGMAVVGDELFILRDGNRGVVLARGDATTNGTKVVATGLSATSQRLVAVGGRVYFAAYPRNGCELWTSDGTARGTRRLRRFPAVGGVVPRLDDLRAVGSRRLFFHVTATAGLGGELWQSDGTVVGTRVVADLWRGPGGDNGPELTVAGGRVFFRADDGRSGSRGGDLWVLDPGAVTHAAGSGCAADGFAPRLTGTDPVLGGTMAIEVRGAPRKTGLFFLGVPLRRPWELGRACRVYPEPITAFAVGLGTDAAGRWGLTKVPVPGLASVIGLRLVAQVALASNPQRPLGADFSNGLLLVGGR